LFGNQTVSTQLILPVARPDSLFWFYHEIIDIREWAQATRAQAEIDCYSAVPGITSLNLLKVWAKISGTQFDYIMEPVNTDMSAPSLCFEPERGTGSGLGNYYGYITMNGVVVHGSKLNTMLWAVFGRYWGYSTGMLKNGAHFNELYTRYHLDKPSSQAAVENGGHYVDVRENQGVSTLLEEMQPVEDWESLVDPVDLILHC
jgi:hypothetical protein